MFKGELDVGGVATVVEGGAGLFEFLVHDVDVIEEEGV